MKKLCVAVMVSLVALSASASGNIEAGKALAAKYSCAACHGVDYKTPIDPTYPKLAGQHPDYLVHALTAYKRGDAPNGRNNAIMTGQVKPLTNQDVLDLAAYLGSLPTTLVVHR